MAWAHPFGSVTSSVTVRQSASRLPQPYRFLSVDRLTSWAKMKRLNSAVDDNEPIYIFILLFTILLFSFLATTDFKRSNTPNLTKP